MPDPHKSPPIDIEADAAAVFSLPVQLYRVTARLEFALGVFCFQTPTVEAFTPCDACGTVMAYYRGKQAIRVFISKWEVV